MASRGEVAAATAASQGAPATRARFRLTRLSDTAVFVFSIAASLAAWELVSRTGLISQADLPSMSASFRELWSLVQTSDFWGALLQTVRGWALGLAVAAALAIPIGILLGSSDFAATAFRVPIEFLRPIPSAALLPVLFLTLGTTLKSEIFLAAFGAFWPLLVQTMYGVRDVDPVALDTARSFGVGRFERLYRLKLPSAVPYIATGMRISSTVSLILAFTAELFMGTPGLGQKVNFASSFGLHEQLYAYALATGFLGVAIHFFTSAAEKRVLHWHPSQRGEAV
jgi:ABC-type nitrate/sulfonate/bicarbonate transport system permease component